MKVQSSAAAPFRSSRKSELRASRGASVEKMSLETLDSTCDLAVTSARTH